MARIQATALTVKRKNDSGRWQEVYKTSRHEGPITSLKLREGDKIDAVHPGGEEITYYVARCNSCEHPHEFTVTTERPAA